METVAVATEKDQKIGVIVSVLSLLFLFIFLYLTTFEKADPGPEELRIPAEIPLEAMIIKNLKVETSSGSKGGGAPSNDKIDPKPTQKTEKILTSTKVNPVKVNSGNAHKTTAPNSKDEATSIKKSNNPFGDGGADGKKGTGFGKDEGEGEGFGPDKGPGKGIGNGTKRIRITDPSVDDIESDANCTVQMRVKVDENGNVISATCTALTTTISQLLKNKVCAATIKTAKYNKKPGAGIEEAFITVLIHAK